MTDDTQPEPRRHRRWPAILITAAVTAAIAVGGTLWWANRNNDDGTVRALAYARKACKAIDPGGPVDIATTTPADQTSEAEAWQGIADNAARAARLDAAWNELAYATDAEARVWWISNEPTRQGEIPALQAVIAQHPADPECRKALVD